MGTTMKGLIKGLRYISHVFDEKEQELQIGLPTDVKHVAHIGNDGPGGSDATKSEADSSGGEPASNETARPARRHHHHHHLHLHHHSSTSESAEGTKRVRKHRHGSGGSESTVTGDGSASASQNQEAPKHSRHRKNKARAPDGEDDTGATKAGK